IIKTFNRLNYTYYYFWISRLKKSKANSLLMMLRNQRMKEVVHTELEHQGPATLRRLPGTRVYPVTVIPKDSLTKATLQGKQGTRLDHLPKVQRIGNV